MNYINTINLEQVTESQIRALNSNTSFPSPFIPPSEYALIFPAPRPEYNPVTQTVQEIAPELTVLGTWEQRFTITELFETQPERDSAIAADLETKRLASIPVEVSPRQLRQALTAMSLRSAVEAAVAASSQDIKDWWEFATTFERKHPMVIEMAESLSVTALQLDSLFVMAATL